MSEICGALNKVGFVCQMDGRHAMHRSTRIDLPFGHADAIVLWPNDDFVPLPPPASKTKGKTAEQLRDMADKVQGRPAAAGFMPNTDPKLLAREDGPDTSAKAASSASLRSGSQKALLLEQYARSDGLTDEEAATLAGLIGRRGCCWWHRSSDLRSDGMIFDTRITRIGESGEERMVCAITPLGAEAAAKLNLISSSS